MKQPLLTYLLIAAFLLPATNGFSREYFQQEVNYSIDVYLDDQKHELLGNENIEYKNNSPDALLFIYIHLWPNAYRDTYTSLAKQKLGNRDTKFLYAPDDQRGYIDQLDFKVNGKPAKLEYDTLHADIAKLILPDTLKSGQKIFINTPFHVKIPDASFSRLGHSKQSYQISQWYPKPAVYDRNGWNPMPYLDQGEFYSEFGTFDIMISLPSNYVVGATGDLVDGEKENEWMEEKAKETRLLLADSSAVLKMSGNSFYDSIPASSAEIKTLHFRQSNVHDFAWFADKRYHVLKGEVTLPRSGRKITTLSLFTNRELNLWKKSIEYLNHAILSYSSWIGDYPYNQAAVAEGTISAGGGMEYPNIAVIGKAGSASALELIIIHEAGHNWFYGILGSNERKHPWMDEGINSYYEDKYMMSVSGSIRFSKKRGLRFTHHDIYDFGYLLTARSNTGQPIELPAPEYSYLNYPAIVYGKTALAFSYLRAYKGDSLFNLSMQRYFETWKFRHPEPEDLRKIFTETCNDSLAWFFNDLINTSSNIDYKICGFAAEGQSSLKIKIKNKGGISSPFSITSIKKDSVVAENWYAGFKGKQEITFPAGNYDLLKIDASRIIPEINRRNNSIRANGIFRKTEPLRIRPFGFLENPDRTEIRFAPLVAWDNYDKTLAGAVFYNAHLPGSGPVSYLLAPLYSTGSGKLAGAGNIGVDWRPGDDLFQSIHFYISGASYSYNNIPFLLDYRKISPGVIFTFKKESARNPVNRSIQIRSVWIDKGDVKYVGDSFPYTKVRIRDKYSINDFTYTLNNERIIDPSSTIVNIQQGKDFIRASLETNRRFSYKGRDKGFDIRFFLGGFLINNTDGAYQVRMAGLSGSNDYLFDGTFFGRSERNGWMSNQFMMKEGGFKLPVFVGNTDKWLAALNLRTSLPVPLPVRIFADIGTYENAKKAFEKSKQFIYDVGLEVTLLPGICSIYFPFPEAMSDDLKYILDINNIKYSQTIRFELNFSSFVFYNSADAARIFAK